MLTEPLTLTDMPGVESELPPSLCCNSRSRADAISTPVSSMSEELNPLTVTISVEHPGSTGTPLKRSFNHASAAAAPVTSSDKCSPTVFFWYCILTPRSQYPATYASVSVIGDTSSAMALYANNGDWGVLLLPITAPQFRTLCTTGS